MHLSSHFPITTHLAHWIMKDTMQSLIKLFGVWEETGNWPIQLWAELWGQAQRDISTTKMTRSIHVCHPFISNLLNLFDLMLAWVLKIIREVESCDIFIRANGQDRNRSVAFLWNLKLEFREGVRLEEPCMTIWELVQSNSNTALFLLEDVSTRCKICYVRYGTRHHGRLAHLLQQSSPW